MNLYVIEHNRGIIGEARLGCTVYESTLIYSICIDFISMALDCSFFSLKFDSCKRSYASDRVSPEEWARSTVREPNLFIK